MLKIVLAAAAFAGFALPAIQQATQYFQQVAAALGHA